MVGVPQSYTAIYDNEGYVNGSVYHMGASKFKEPVSNIIQFAGVIARDYLPKISIVINDHCCASHFNQDVHVVVIHQRSYNPWSRGVFWFGYLNTDNGRHRGNENDAVARLLVALVGAIVIAVGSCFVEKNLALATENHVDTTYLQTQKRHYIDLFRNEKGHIFPGAQPHVDAIDALIADSEILLDRVKRNAVFGVAMGVALIASGIIAIVGAIVAAEAAMAFGLTTAVVSLTFISLQATFNDIINLEGRCAKRMAHHINFLQNTQINFIPPPQSK